MYSSSAIPNSSRYGPSAAPALSMGNSSNFNSTDEFVRNFSARLSQLSDPVLREVLDPLVIDAQQFASSSQTGGQTVVGIVESALLRAPTNKKYAICVFIDALCRARSLFPFKVHFAQNLERLFSHAYLEADKIGKEKMVRLLNIWKKGNRGVYLFDQLLLDRIRARCDPDYDGEPVDSLPQPRLTPVPQPAPAASYAPPPSMPVNPYAGGYVAPPVMPPSYVHVPAVVTPPPLPFQPQQEQLVYARAAELLRNLYAQMAVPEPQQIPLNDIYRANPELYQQIMAQAHREIATPSPVIPVPAQPDAVSKPATPPPSALLLSKLNAQNVLERTHIPYFTAILEMAPKPVSAKSKREKRMAQRTAQGAVSARAWYLVDSDWKAGKTSATEVSFKLFAESGSGSSAGGEPMKEKASDGSAGVNESSVPKDDSQTRCGLSGEEFETFWNSDEQMWMYKNAIRPDPNGPIYKLHAWLAHQRGGDASSSSLDPRKRGRFGE